MLHLKKILLGTALSLSLGLVTLAQQSQTNLPISAAKQPAASPITGGKSPITGDKSKAGFSAEVQVRPGFHNPWRLPLMEIYLTNPTGQTNEWKRALLDGQEIQNLTNGVNWVQWYPSAKAPPGQMTLLQVCLEEAPLKAQHLTAETVDGHKVEVELPGFPPPPSSMQGMIQTVAYDVSHQPFSLPATRLTGITFSMDFQRAFILYSATAKDVQPKQLLIDGKDVTAGMQFKAVSAEELPRFAGSAGMMVARLPEPTAQGKPIHVRAQFSDGSAAQGLLRAWKGIFLDDFGIKEGGTGEKLRKELGLDAVPSFKALPSDPACNDFHARRTGASMPAVLRNRRQSYEAGEPWAVHLYECTSGDQESYACYGQATDGLQVNSYRLAWGSQEHFVEDEETYFRWGREAAAPRPWFWIPEAFSLNQRMLEADEYRLLWFSALGNGLKGESFYKYGDAPGNPKHKGYEKSPSLLAEIKKANTEIKKLEPILAPSLPISSRLIGSRDKGTCQYTLWSGDEGVLVVARNLDYTTDRKPNDLGKKPRFKFTPKTNVELIVQKPLWWGELGKDEGERMKDESRGKKTGASTSNVERPISNLQVLDPLTQEIIPFKEDAQTIHITLTKLDLGRILWIPTPK